MRNQTAGETGPEPYDDLLELDILDRSRGRERLVGSRCRQCGHLQIGMHAMCAACPSSTVDKVDLAGRGTLYTYTTLHVGSPTPRSFGQVDLLDGLRILTVLDESVVPTIGMSLVLKVDSISWVFSDPSTLGAHCV